MKNGYDIFSGAVLGVVFGILTLVAVLIGLGKDPSRLIEFSTPLLMIVPVIILQVRGHSQNARIERKLDRVEEQTNGRLTERLNNQTEDIAKRILKGEL